jgi:ankyrin repeat protein
MIKQAIKPIIYLLLLLPSGINATNLHDYINAKDTEKTLGEIRNAKNTDQLNELVEGYAPIHLAVKNNLYDIVVRLVDAKVDKNILSIDQETPALLALKLQNIEILEYLLKSDAKIDGENLYNFISNSHKDPIEQEGLTTDAEFMHHIQPMLRHEGAREVLALIYPLFCRDEEFFGALADIMKRTQTPPWQISQVLYTIINANFPNGLPSKSAVRKISELLDEMQASTSLRLKIWMVLKSKRDNFQKRNHRASRTLPPNLSSYKKEWDNSDAFAIATALTEHNARLFQAISPVQFRLWLKDQNASSAIKDCLTSHHKLINFFAFLIVSEQQASVRIARLQKTARVLHELERRNNFWGINLLAVGTNQQVVMRLFEGEKINKVKQTLKEATWLVDPQNDTEYIKKLDQLDKEEPRLPLITHLLSALKSTYAARPDKFDVEWFIAVGRIVKNFSRFKNQSAYNIPADKVATEIFDSAILVPDDVIVEFSNVQIPWSKNIKREYPITPIQDWSALDLFSALDHKGSPKITKELLEAGIWDGKTLIDNKQDHKELSEQLSQEIVQADKSKF